MSDYIFYSTLAVNFGLISLAFATSFSAIQKGKERVRYLARFTICSLAVGFISGFPLFYGVLWIFDFWDYHVNLGHGEILIAAPLFNLLFGAALAILGTLLLRWVTING